MRLKKRRDKASLGIDDRADEIVVERLVKIAAETLDEIGKIKGYLQRR